MVDNLNQKENEEIWYKFWEEKGYFKAQPDSKKPSYSLLMPPPNLTGELHLGHAMQHSIMDTAARFKRLQGFDVLLLPGVDHAGIQFEGTLEKKLSKEGLSKYKLGRIEWLKKAWEFKEEMYKSFHKTWTVFGISADWSREVFTLSPEVQKAVFEEFKTFWDQDLLYKGAYIVQWCSKCGTAIEDLEMEYREKREKLYFVKYKVEGFKDEYIVAATARPETIYADTGIAVYKNHPKFSRLIGKKAENPLTGRLIPIFTDKRVDKNFGSGALKITPGHDPLDFEIGKDHNLPILHAVDKQGKMTDLTEDLVGLKIGEARKLAVEKLEKLGAVEKAEDYTHSVPVCERCKTVVEPLISEEWFVTMNPLADKALKNIKKINFVPRNYLKIISDFLKNLHDWSISRSLWWGHRIPVWYCQTCNPGRVVGKDKDMAVSFEKPKFACQTCHKHDWFQDDQVLDTWFSSGMWPLVTLGWPDSVISPQSSVFSSRSIGSQSFGLLTDKPKTGKQDSDNRQQKTDNRNELQRYFPWDFEISAPEIKFLWIARMIMLALWFADDIPFENMFFTGMLRDLQGRKFSKSLGNGIDPNHLREQWGTDSTRMALYTYAIPGRDGKTSRQIMDERCKNFRNFGTKLRNITRFIVELKQEQIASLSLAPRDDNGNIVIASEAKQSEDKWILDELNRIIDSVTKNIDTFQLHLAVEDLYEFVWHQFADKYLEESKKRRQEAQPVLEHVLKNVLILLHPFMPFTTEELYQKLPNHKESIMLETWPS
ncbi:MAG: class I tRNA ligase family protein [bacterium]|nr:class I tRNA ligase family protein [bacterium]